MSPSIATATPSSDPGNIRTSVTSNGIAHMFEATSISIEEALNRAYAHWHAGQADQAELFCQRVLAAWPGQTDALHLMGLMAHAYGNLDLALEHLRRACQAPRAPAAYFGNFAEMCRQKGLLEEGEQAGRRATALDPNLVGAWNNLGIILQEAGKLEESLSCLERVVALQPDYAEAHNNLANTCRRLGRLDRAETHYARALALNPSSAKVHNNLATLLTYRGQYHRAATEARRAIDLNPRLADAYINLAAAEAARGNHGDSLRWLDALLAFAPADSGGLAARALALKQFDRLDAALDSAKRSVAAQPMNAAAHDALGQVLQAQNRFDEALAAFDKAAALPSTIAEDARVNRAVLLMETGRNDEALAAIDAVLSAYPRSASAWFSRGDLKTFTADDPDIPRMERLLQPDGVQSFNDRMSLHFALGKAYLDAGEGARAFQHLGAGNRMKRSTFVFDAAVADDWMKRTANTFSPALFERFARAGAGSALPVFVVGIPRSGTTLVEQILASHPQVYGAGELSAVQRLADGIADYPAGVERLTRSDVARLGGDYLARVEHLADGRRYLVDKMPANFLHLGLIRVIQPNARIIHCRRDPVDTCLSCYAKLFASEQTFAYDLGELGRFHRSYQALMDHWRTVFADDRFIEVDYEAIVDDLESQARRLVDFLGLPWHDACLRYHENNRPVRTASVNQVRQPIYKTSVGRWKRYAAHLAPLLEVLAIDASP
jgi:tetratricopeptide (TPR) repeat protein